MILLHVPVTPSATLSKERHSRLWTEVQTKAWEQHWGLMEMAPLAGSEDFRVSIGSKEAWEQLWGPDGNGSPRSAFSSIHNNLENPHVPFLRILLLLNTCQNLRHEPGSLIPLDAPKTSGFKWSLTESFVKVMLPHSMLSVIRHLWEQAIGVLLESWHILYSSPNLVLSNPNANTGS